MIVDLLFSFRFVFFFARLDGYSILYYIILRRSVIPPPNFAFNIHIYLSTWRYRFLRLDKTDGMRVELS